MKTTRALVVMIALAGLALVAGAQTRAPLPPVPMTEELMARILKLVVGQSPDGSSIEATSSRLLGLWDQTTAMPTRSAEADTATDGAVHLIQIPERNKDDPWKDILFIRWFKQQDRWEIFLTDRSLKLRAALQFADHHPVLVLNEKAQEQFEKELALMASEAAVDLPPADEKK